MITARQLAAIMPRVEQAERYATLLSSAMIEAQINTVLRAAAFLGQLAHESGELRWFEELDSGDRYEGRRDLGNDQPGDGRRYKGRGPIQLTGRRNYREFGTALNLPLEEQPTLAASPEHGFRIAALYWTRRNCNQLADDYDQEGVTRAVNGALNGLGRRMRYYWRALEVLGKDAIILAAATPVEPQRKGCEHGN